VFAPLPDDPKVLGIVEDNPTGPHASDLWRTVRPFYELERRGYPTVTALHTTDAINSERPDVVILPRQVATERPAIQAFVDACHARGCAVIIDWDDTPTLHSRAYEAVDWIKVQAGCWDWMGIADAVTFTTPYLRDLWKGACKRAYWLPNLIAPEVWTDRPKVQRTGAVTIGLQGGNSHEKDWAICGWLWKVLAKRYPNLHFVTVGYSPAYLRDAVPATRFHHFNWTDSWHHPLTLQWIDIGLCPLEATDWNRCKSPIKWMEYTLAGAATILRPTMYLDWVSPDLAEYAESPEQWLEASCRLIEDAERRRSLVDRSRAEVLEWHTFSDERCRMWMDVYRTVHREVFGELHSGNESSRTAGGPRQPVARVGAEGLESAPALYRGRSA
jgi:Glycosyl transferases group 1